MTTAGMMERIAEAPRHHKGWIIGAYYFLTILAGVFVLSFQGTLTLGTYLTLTIVYITVTVLFYRLSKKRE